MSTAVPNFEKQDYFDYFSIISARSLIPHVNYGMVRVDPENKVITIFQLIQLVPFRAFPLILYENYGMVQADPESKVFICWCSLYSMPKEPGAGGHVPTFPRFVNVSVLLVINTGCLKKLLKNGENHIVDFQFKLC